MEFVMLDRCVRCGRAATLKDQRLCTACGLALYKSLGDVADDLAARNPHSQAGRPMHVLESVQQKRLRTGTYRFYAAPASIKAGVQ